jgi:hypothetical protein
VYAIEVEPERHASVWAELRKLHGETGLWPFVCHDPPEHWADESLSSGVDLDERLAGLRRDPQEVIDELIRAEWEKAVEYAGGYPDRLEVRRRLRDIEFIAAELGPALALPLHPESQVDRTRTFPARWIHLVPAEHGYEVPALLDGPVANDWVGSPSHPDLLAADHGPVLRSWQERYGAELYYFGDTAIELVVAQPPLDPVEAARVAVEQYAYCPDLENLIGEPVDIARRQVRADRWYFWWD